MAFALMCATAFEHTLFAFFSNQSGTLWYQSSIFRNVTIFGNVTKNGMSFVLRMETPIPKMATVTYKLLYFPVWRLIWDYQHCTGCPTPRPAVVTIAPHSLFGTRPWNKVWKISHSRIHFWQRRFFKWKRPAVTIIGNAHSKNGNSVSLPWAMWMKSLLVCIFS